MWVWDLFVKYRLGKVTAMSIMCFAARALQYLDIYIYIIIRFIVTQGCDISYPRNYNIDEILSFWDILHYYYTKLET